MNTRMFGKVHKVDRTWAIVEGDNGQHYFFMPADLRPPNVFRDIIIGKPVEGEPYLHNNRLRMKDVVVVTDLEGVTHAAANSR